MDEGGVIKKVLNTKITRKCSIERPKSKWEEYIRKYVTQKDGRTWAETEEKH
jgi:hypothetical protein